jgi:hypothetical protein
MQVALQTAWQEEWRPQIAGRPSFLVDLVGKSWEINENL